MRLLVWGVCACVVASLAAACDRPGGVSASAASLPAIGTAVGPVPGPGPEPPHARNPIGGSVAAMTEGRDLFVRMNCSGCHGGHAGGGMGPSLRDVDWLYGSTDEQIFSSIAEGRAYGMPAWGSRLQQDQLWKLVAYITSMRTPDEPDPPS